MPQNDPSDSRHIPLQRLNLGTHCGLRHVKPFRGSCEAQFVGNGQGFIAARLAPAPDASRALSQAASAIPRVTADVTIDAPRLLLPATGPRLAKIVREVRRKLMDQLESDADALVVETSHVSPPAASISGWCVPRGVPARCFGQQQ